MSPDTRNMDMKSTQQAQPSPPHRRQSAAPPLQPPPQRRKHNLRNTIGQRQRHHCNHLCREGRCWPYRHMYIHQPWLSAITSLADSVGPTAICISTSHASASAICISPPATAETIPSILFAIETGTKTRTATAGGAPFGTAANGATTAATRSYAAFWVDILGSTRNLPAGPAANSRDFLGSVVAG